MEGLHRRILYVLGALGCIALAIKLVPILRFGPFAFGYDSGFYRRYVIEPFVSFPNTPVPGLDHTVFIPRFVLDIVRFFIAQPDIALYGTYVVFTVVGAGCVWYFARRYLSQNAALYAASLYILSGIQFIAYGDFFFKEAIALPLFLFAVLSFEKERYGWAAALGVLVVLTQQTTSIMLICIAALGFLFKIAFERKISIKYIFSGTAILAAYLLLHPHVAQKIASSPVGIFLTQTEYLFWSAPLLALAALGLRKFLPFAKRKPLLAAALAVPLAFAAFHLPFYNRIYVFLDMFLVMPGAFGVEAIIHFVSARARTLAVSALCCIFIVAAAPLAYLEATQTPLLSPDLQKALPALASLPAHSAVITSPALLPWVQGWIVAPVYAPGNLKEPHLMSDWKLYWAHKNPQFEREFLASFPRPLYVFVGPAQMEYRPACATPVNSSLFSLDSCK